MFAIFRGEEKEKVDKYQKRMCSDVSDEETTVHHLIMYRNLCHIWIYMVIRI